VSIVHARFPPISDIELSFSVVQLLEAPRPCSAQAFISESKRLLFTSDAFRKKNVGALADKVPLNCADFERDYLAAKIKGHTELIEMIDTKLVGDARSEDVRQHVQTTRDNLAAHLAQAKALQPALNW